MIEDQLHDLLDLPADLPNGLARRSWTRGRRQRRQQWGAGAAAGALAVGGVVGVVAVATPEHRASLTSPAGFGATTGGDESSTPLSTYSGTPSPGTSETASPLVTPSATAPATAPTYIDLTPSPQSSAQIAAFVAAQRANNAAMDPGLAAVMLPDPAPGFPVRRDPDQGPVMSGYGPGKDGLTAEWLVAVTPDHQDASGGGSPTGQQATVTVGRPGLFATTADSNGKVDGYRVVGHATARGVSAIVVREGTGETGLLLQQGGFSIGVYAFNAGPDGSSLTTDVPVDKLVALADALQGIPTS